MRLSIQFDTDAYEFGPDHHLNEFRPSPASEHLPEWFKNLQNGEHGEKTGKTCRGLYDVMTSGYMVVWPFDVLITRDEQGKLFVKRTRNNEHDHYFHPHPHFQLGQYPDANLSVQKFGVEKVNLPYRIKTPKGTSVQYMQPPYRPDLKTEVMPGIIDTDKFYTQLNVLFTIKDHSSNKDLKITAGTPLVQIVPFVRSEWDVEYGMINTKLDRTIQENLEHVDKYYQKKLWTRKVFKRNEN